MAAIVAAYRTPVDGVRTGAHATWRLQVVQVVPAKGKGSDRKGNGPCLQREKGNGKGWPRKKYLPAHLNWHSWMVVDIHGTPWIEAAAKLPPEINALSGPFQHRMFKGPMRPLDSAFGPVSTEGSEFSPGSLSHPSRIKRRCGRYPP